MGKKEGRYLTELRRSSAASPVNREISRGQEKRMAIEEELNLGEGMANPSDHELDQNSNNRVSCSACDWKRSFDRELPPSKLRVLQNQHQKAIEEEIEDAKRRKTARDNFY